MARHYRQLFAAFMLVGSVSGWIAIFTEYTRMFDAVAIMASLAALIPAIQLIRLERAARSK